MNMECTVGERISVLPDRVASAVTQVEIAYRIHPGSYSFLFTGRTTKRGV